MTLNTEYKHKRLTQENKLCLEKVWFSEKVKKKKEGKENSCCSFIWTTVDDRGFLFGPKTANVTIRGKIYIACCNHLK